MARRSPRPSLPRGERSLLVGGVVSGAVTARDGVVRVEEEAEWGSVVSQRLMGLAGDIDAGELETAAAIEQARVLIAGATRP